MKLEIERKFKLSSIPKNLDGIHIIQGYFLAKKDLSVRIRISKQNHSRSARLTIKGPSSETGLSRPEFETPISVQDAIQLLRLSKNRIIEKIRYEYLYDGFMWELDEFLGKNKGLFVAEIELESEGQQFNKPDFIGREVTGQIKYYNMMLLKNPYTTW